MAATVWSGSISFGLVSFPVRLIAAARAETIRFNMLHRKDLSRVKEVWYCAEEDKPIDRADIIKGHEIRKGEYVVVEDEDLKKIAPPTASTIEVVQFVARDEVDPIYFEKSYYLAPDEKIAKPYALFLKALTDTKQDAIAKLAMHSREHVVLIRPSKDGLVLHTLYYEDELRATHRPAAPKSTFTSKELDLAKNLIEHLSAPFRPKEFHDTYRENVQHMLEQKDKGQKIAAVKQPRKAPVVDLLEALKRSLKSAPPASSPARKPASATRHTRKSAGRRHAA